MPVSVEHVQKRYGRKQVLRDLSLELTTGIYGLLGPNGAGKSTLLKLMATILPADSGTIRVGAFTLPRQGDAVRRQLGYLPQLFGMYESLSGLEFLRYAAAMKGVDPARQREEVDFWLHEVGLDDAAHQRIKGYSGGMRQRLGIAQAMMGRPCLLILDEPTAGLDPDERVHFHNMLSDYARHATVLFSTHIVSDVETLADRIGILLDGRLQAEGTPQEIARLAEGHVWKVTMAVEAWEQASGRLLDRPKPGERLAQADRPIVAAIEREGRQVILRLVARQAPFEEAQPVDPTVEDGYLAVTAGLHRQANRTVGVG